MMRSDTALAALASLLSCLTGEPARGQGREWMFGPFVKPARVNPAITPRATSTFRSPPGDGSVRGAECATVNPAAAVKDGKAYALYRAAGASGEVKISRQTSPSGLAES